MERNTMTDQRIIENKLIAEFDKLEQVDYGDNTIIYRREGNLGYRPENLKYHTNWEWLMPVVEKIETLGYTVNISSSVVHIYSDKHQIPLSIGTTFNKLRATYQAVVEFIIWYNKKRK